MAITAASTAALALLDSSNAPLPIHSRHPSGVNLQCGEHLIHASSRPDRGVSSLCMAVSDVELLWRQRPWRWSADALMGADGRSAISMDEDAVRYPTSAPPPPVLSTVTPHRLARARARTGRHSWFDEGTGLTMGLPNLRCTLRALVHHTPDAVESFPRIVGLGVGLTPSADDALVGALCLLIACEALAADLRGHLKRWLRAGGAEATTDVSMSYLRFAVDGAFSAPVTRVVRCLAESVSQVELDTSVRVLSELGETSGLDTAMGIQLACELLIQERGNNDLSGILS